MAISVYMQIVFILPLKLVKVHIYLLLGSTYMGNSNSLSICKINVFVHMPTSVNSCRILYICYTHMSRANVI